MSKYTLEIEPGAKRGTWQWQINDPAGQPHAWGASMKTKADLERDLKKPLKRLNEHCASWNGCEVKNRQRARKKLLESPRNTSVFSKSEDQIVIDYYPTEGWQGVHARLGGKFTKSKIYARAHRLDVHAERYAKRSRWVA